MSGGLDDGDRRGCVRCRASVKALPRCPFCGTTAEELRAPMDVEYAGVTEDKKTERALRIWAVPVVFCVAAVAMQFQSLHNLARMLMTMWLHELGHAVTGWLTGYPSLPGPWRTWSSDHRSWLLTAVIVLVCAGIAYRMWQHEKRRLSYVAGAVALLALLGAVAISPRTAKMLFSFGGDAGMMLFGAGLVMTFWARPGTHLHTSWLRWGFLVIGAFAILDGLWTWWPARSDPSVIPYGEIEGVGLSDPTKLVDLFGWSQKQLVARFVAVGVVAALAVLSRWLFGLWQLRGDR